MKNFIYFQMRLLLLSALAIPTSAWPQQNSDYPTISIQGNEYRNACDPVEKEKLKEVLKNENVPSKAEAWEILDMLLCAPRTEKNVNKMFIATSSKIRTESEGTGEKESNIETVQRDLKIVKEFFAQGHAWRARLIVINNSVRLHYSENESCIEERIIEFAKSKWKIVEAGQACD